MTAAEPEWLDMRVPFDNAARQHSLHLRDRAVTALARAGHCTAETDRLLVIDLGAGTGNSARWFDARLRERLPGRDLDWVLIDTDRASLDLAAASLPQARTICASIAELPEITADLYDRKPRTSPVLLTCSALLDVLTADDLDAIMNALTRCRGLGLFVLSITGRWALEPAHPDDIVLNDAFTAHQHRDGRLGHDAPAALTSLAEHCGATTATGSSPWRLTAPRDAEFLTRFLAERIAAAVDQAPELSESGQAWLDDRLARLRTGLTVTVDHQDLLIDARGADRA